MMLRKRMLLYGMLSVLIHRDKGVAQIVHFLSTIHSHGSGLDVGAFGAYDSLLFQKTLLI